jgi:hypothetical protein
VRSPTEAIAGVMDFRVEFRLGRVKKRRDESALLQCGEALERLLEKIRNKEPFVHHFIELPIKISVSPDGSVQIDSPLALSGVDEAAIQRVFVQASPQMLRAAFQALENNPDVAVKLTASPFLT